jgi:hypothetical protein
VAGPSDAQEVVENFRKALLRQESRASAQVIRAYGSVHQRLQSDTLSLVKIAQSRGLNPSQVLRMQRMKDLERQFLANATKFAQQAGSIVTDSQRAAVGLARRGALQATTAGLPPGVTMDNMAKLGMGWNQLPVDAFQNFVGIAGDGAPLGNLLNPLGPEAIAGVREKIGEGIALGKGPRATANLVRNAAGIPLSKSLLITRTETNRAFREATRLSYQSNSQVVKGYRRHADQSDSTCIACIVLDGTLYPLNEPLNEHPNGRCAMIPEVLDYADLGLDVERLPEPPTARTWFTQQPALTQRKILGEARFNAWQAGDIELRQLSVVKPNKVWGNSAVIRPLKEIKTYSGRPIQQIPSVSRAGAPSSAVRGTPPVPKKPTELIDPLSGNIVRGTKTKPPSVEEWLPPGWKGDPEDFLDVSSDIGRGATKARVNEAVREQEAWARAAGGAIEVNYQGLSIRAAEQVNKAVEVTIVRNNWRPLDILTTKKREGRGGIFGRAYAYQSGNGVHINAKSASRTRNPSLQGSTRSWDAHNLVDNAYVKKQNMEGAERIAKLETELKNKRTIYAEWAKKGDIDALIVDPEMVARGVHPMRFSVYDAYITQNEQALKLAKKQLGQSMSERFHPTTGAEFLKEVVTHEIGHYGHRRWGFFEQRSVDVLKSKAGREEARLLSQYAMVNDREHFAEAFTEYIWLGGARNSAKVNDFIASVIKANTDNPVGNIVH